MLLLRWGGSIWTKLLSKYGPNATKKMIPEPFPAQHHHLRWKPHRLKPVRISPDLEPGNGCREYQEGLVALRKLLGYSRSPDWTPSLAGFPFDDRLPDSPMRDVLFVGLDIDTNQGYVEILPDHKAHIGVSILDTRKLQGLLRTVHAAQNVPPEDSPAEGLPAESSPAENLPTEEQTEHGIKSYQFITDDHEYCARAVEFFRFGPSEKIDLSDFNSRFEALVAGRNVVLVIHGAHNDLTFLGNLGFNIQSRYVIDTSTVTSTGSSQRRAISLARLMAVFGIPVLSSPLHVSGNDAHFALRALLLIAVQDAHSQGPANRNSWIKNDSLDVLLGIGLARGPLTVTKDAAGLRGFRRLKAKWAKERKQRSRAWRIAIKNAHAMPPNGPNFISAKLRAAEKAAEKAAKRKAFREMAKLSPKQKGARRKAAKKEAARVKAARVKAAKEKAAKDEAARKKAAIKAAKKAAKRARKAAKEKAANEVPAVEETAEEKAAREAAKKRAAEELAARRQAAKEIAARRRALEVEAAQKRRQKSARKQLVKQARKARRRFRRWMAAEEKRKTKLEQQSANSSATTHSKVTARQQQPKTMT